METSATDQERPLVVRELVKAHFVAAMVSFIVALFAGFFFSLLFLQSYPFEGVELLSAGRVRMVHTNLIAFGFLFNAFVGGLYWAIPRVTNRPVFNKSLGWVIFWAWQLILVCTFLGILAGTAQAVEWGETPVWVDPLVVVGAVLLMVQFFPCIARSEKKALYVTAWYVSAGLIWTGVTYLMGNYLPQFFVPGASGAAITGLYIHDLVGLFVTPMGWGLMYYFVPVILKKPIFSHGLSLIGFWGLAFFYPLTGVHHFLYSPIPIPRLNARPRRRRIAAVQSHCLHCGLPAGNGHSPQEDFFCCYGCRLAFEIWNDDGDGDGDGERPANRMLARMMLAIFFSMGAMVFTTALYASACFPASQGFEHTLGPLAPIFQWLAFVFALPVLFLLGWPLLRHFTMQVDGLRGAGSVNVLILNWGVGCLRSLARQFASRGR